MLAWSAVELNIPFLAFFLPEDPIIAYSEESDPEKDLQFNQVPTSLGTS